LPSSFESVLVPVLYWLFVAVPAVEPFVQIFRRPQLVRVVVMEFSKLLRTAYKIPCRVPIRIRVVAFPAHLIL
jgi:hypothetical protein